MFPVGSRLFLVLGVLLDSGISMNFLCEFFRQLPRQPLDPGGFVTRGRLRCHAGCSTWWRDQGRVLVSVFDVVICCVCCTSNHTYYLTIRLLQWLSTIYMSYHVIQWMNSCLELDYHRSQSVPTPENHLLVTRAERHLRLVAAAFRTEVNGGAANWNRGQGRQGRQGWGPKGEIPLD